MSDNWGYLVNMAAWRKLNEMFPTPRIESEFDKIRMPVHWSGMPIYTSPYLHTTEPPPSILKEFDRWFAAAVRRHTKRPA